MFANRRKRLETNKITYLHNNLVNSTAHANEDDILWKRNAATSASDKNYKSICSDLSVGKESEPVATLDISGSVNVSTTYTINQVSIAPPVGSIMAFTVPKSPDGWLICDGSVVCRHKYASLFDVIGTTFGEGDCENTFRLPNYQGAFLRGTGTNGIYSGPPANTPQAHATQTHTHVANTVLSDPGHKHTQTHSHNATVYDPGHSHVITTYKEVADTIVEEEGTKGPSFGKKGGATTQNTVINGTNTGIAVGISKDSTDVNASRTGISVSTSISKNSGITDANETRPYNYGVYWIIKH